MKSKSVILLASAARTATPTAIELDTGQFTEPGSSRSFTKINANELINLHITIDVTAVALTPSVQVAIEAFDDASGKYYSLLAAIAAITGVGTTTLKIGENIASAAGLAAQDFIPKKVRISFTHADTDSITYSAGLNYQER